jgi:hypothetical protein
MKGATLVACLLLAPTLTAAREKYDAKTMSEAAIVALHEQRLAVARHEMPKLEISAGALREKGASVIRDVASDPAELIARELASAMAKEFGMHLREDPVFVPKAGKPESAIAALLPDADYVLDVATNDRRVFFVPSSAILTLQTWKYWIGYGVRVRLLNRETGRPVFTANCFADTHEHPAAPTMDALAANDARLFRDVSRGLAWKCLRHIGRYVPLTDEVLPDIPEELADPLAAFAAAGS